MSEKKHITWSTQSFARTVNNTPIIRVFNCNEIIFENKALNEYDDVYINDTYIIRPFEKLYLRCQPGEIDTTAYQFTWKGTSAGILSVWFKT
jgi:hypothetical protein